MCNIIGNHMKRCTLCPDLSSLDEYLERVL